MNSAYKCVSKSVSQILRYKDNRREEKTQYTLSPSFIAQTLHKQSICLPHTDSCCLTRIYHSIQFFGLAQSFPQDICWLILKRRQVKSQYGCASAVGERRYVIRWKRSGVGISCLNLPGCEWVENIIHIQSS